MMTLTEQLKEARRELALRTKTYPGFVKRGLISEGQAAYCHVMCASLSRYQSEGVYGTTPAVCLRH